MVADSTLDSDDTREKLLAAALEQFAERGFYGASIAQIAGEIGLTKQALLYHFKRKEDLYGEVLKRISDRLDRVVREAEASADTPHGQLEEVMIALYQYNLDHPDDSRLLMRELLDNRARAAKAKDWYLRPFLDRIVAVLARIKGYEKVPFAQGFAIIFQMLGALQYWAIAKPSLRRMYGDEDFESIADAYPQEVRDRIARLVRDLP